MMKAVIVLAMHGAPPNDVPQRQVIELVGLHAGLEHAPGWARAVLQRRYITLDSRIRAWPRTAQNDPFWAGSQELARDLRAVTGYEVIVGYNEFCAPSLDEALDQAAALKAEKVIVITPMMTRGGEHSEVEIPAAIRRVQARHPRSPFLYAWPLDISAIAQFLAAQVARLV
jgi:sirohydrochlorin cobaltochelatase